ncbi:beta-ketoacyl synthase domain-containing protein [Colletotrichum plurivorum]|uniref:Beta-ketoacyl synthase domain-containing protein n=1 Tax=Colletotrichum plurivorum TaxID=2175906 RepID=A0A8H6KTS9_9PEZI|nr:beta-ketoacyl synthase domain-containing protein [Colletotrichum plurivorum]
MPSKTTTPSPREPIAVIGTGCRFPGGANTPSKLWEVLSKPRDLLRKVPMDRFNVDSVYHPDGSFHGRTNAASAYFLDEDVRAFDANFFNMQHAEAEVTDPQHRLLLETVYEALSTAGLRVEDLRGSETAVYCGQMMSDYRDLVNFDLDGLPTYAATGTAASILSNRVSYFFDWHGPSVAVHLAVQQLRTGSSKVAIAAGANLILGPVPFVVESKMKMLSPTGRSSMWDEKANGYARCFQTYSGEGVAAIVLKTLSQALRDGDIIECIIRETGVNQDGRSPGITMPSHKAQESLIRQTYAAAGLDPSRPQDRCQYFEAHGKSTSVNTNPEQHELTHTPMSGTGTPAGDPQEAEAIARSFFGERGRSPGEAPLYVGSIKTVIGHTEGTAGVAGLIKTSLAMKHGVIPPNMLFEKLSPKVAPFYENLHVPTQVRPWPGLPSGVPMRASVNSFGTNAHVILEAYQKPGPGQRHTSSAVPLWPITISANSEISLKATAQSLLQYLNSTSNVTVQDVAWTLMTKRSILPVRRALTAQTIPGLCSALEATIASIDKKESGIIVSSADSNRKPEILGIFTGQGAQWPAMGKILVSTVPYAREIISDLDLSLNTLPPAYRPSWKLYDQLMLEGEGSKVYDASYSQPLCCAVQILLVRVLAAAGIKFKAVVGHSSGEIACAYAAGLITASQAIRIAYLRGLVSSKAASPNGVEGAMMAAGCSYEDAQELCGLEVFRDRICVAASNASDSITISGDADAIEEAREVLEDESKFARKLKVDKAYHSFHMQPCAKPYVEALQESACDATEPDVPEPSTIWISSVRPGHRMRWQDITAEYWKDNLLSPVLFSTAVEHVMKNQRPVDLAVEVGCHPALKGPCLKTIEHCAEPGTPELPYVGCMRRGADDIDALAGAFGYMWERFGTASVDLPGLDKILPQATVNNLTKGLPLYPFDRSKSYWLDTRRTRFFLRGGEAKPHPLLGRLTADSTPASPRWHNSLRPGDISWLDGHQLQGQTVFPGAGYVVMVAEAALHVAATRPVRLLEIFDVEIFKAVTFDDENSLVELSISLEVDQAPPSAQHVTACFRIDCCLARENAMSASTSGKLVITLGPGGLDALPAGHAEPPHMTNVSVDSFYNELAAVGYGYNNEFRGIASMRRADFKARGAMRLPPGDDDLVLHPATLDNAFQTLMAAVSAPGDGVMRSLLVPTSIGRIAINPFLCGEAQRSGGEVTYHAASSTGKMGSVSGDIEVCDPATGHVMFLIEGIATKAASAATPADDHHMFMHWEWDQLVPDTLLNNAERAATDADKEVATAMERIVYFYIRSFLDEHPAEELARLAPHHQTYIYWFEHKMEEARQGHSLFYKPVWEQDQLPDIQELVAKHVDNSQVRLIQRVGEGLENVFFHDRNAFELMDHDGLLTEFYGSDCGFGPAYHYMQDALAPILHRYPKMDILEIGAGTGGATRYILEQDPSPSFNSYTFTDISTSFFEKARDKFAPFEEGMEFRALDVRRSPADQGYAPHSYDLVIASNVLHATPNLEETMANVRALLKPGGHLVVVELTDPRHSRFGFIFGLFADWWAGVDDDRVMQPFVTIERWNETLSRTGFSGVVSRFEDEEGEIFPTSVFRCEALNDKVARLREPLAFPARESSPVIVVIGGATTKSARIVREVQRKLPARHFERLARFENLRTMELDPSTKPTFLILSELDDQLFADMNQNKFEALQTLCETAGHMLWVTEDAWHDPVKAMAIGLLRTLRLECVQCAGLQVLDVNDARSLEPEYLAETLLRLEEGSDYEDAGILWTSEPEIYVSKGRSRIPRLKPNRPMNNRLNSGRRQILADADPKTTPVVLCQDYGATYLQSDESFAPGKTLVKLRVHHSLARAIRVGNLGYFNLVEGVFNDSRRPVVALCKENSSLVDAVPDRVAHLPGRDKTHFGAGALLAVAADLVAQTLVAETATGASILIYGAPYIYASRIAQRANEKGIRTTFASIHPEPPTGAIGDLASWVQLHENEAQLGLRQKLPQHASAFYNFSVDQNPVGLSRALCDRFRAQGCPTFQADHLSSLTASSWTARTGSALKMMLEEAVKKMIPAGLGTSAKDAHATPVQELITLQRRVGFDTVVDWTVHDVVSARVRPVDSGSLFSENRAYLLIGLTGDLGRSICRWMLERGAKHVVLTSRHPQIEDKWLEEMRGLGGNVMVVAADVGNEQSLDACLAKIRESMPPIGGIAFGPLVLKDVLLKNMQLDQMQAVLHPKVSGARLLSSRLECMEREHPLEFFIMFSSFVMVCGNPGQSAYGAANAYTHALALSRRNQGLAGSTIDMGAIWGVGYIVRSGKDEEYESLSFKFDKVSERELHALFAEAVVVGRPGPAAQRKQGATNHNDVEVITGMRFLDPKNRELIPHYDDPRVGYYILSEKRGTSAGADTALASIKERLLEAVDMTEVRRIIAEGLAQKLRTTLQITHEDGVRLDTPLIDQGVDSLSAVTIGTWFSKNLNLELPLLKILGGASILDLVEEAADRLHPSAIALVHSSGKEETVAVQINTKLDPVTSPTDTNVASVWTASPTRSSSSEDPPDHAPSSPQERKSPLSLNQEHSWKLQRQSPDPKRFNSTIGMYMKGHIDLTRLARVFQTVLQRHEIFRTRFPDSGLQIITDTPNMRFQAVPVADRAAAERALDDLDRQSYDLAAGETLKLADFYWAPDEHIVVIAYNQLVCDGWTYERLFVELAQVYEGKELPPSPPQYADFAARQRTMFEQGGMDSDLAYWKSLHAKLPSELPILTLPPSTQRGTGKKPPPSCEQHVIKARVSSATASRVRDLSRKHKSTPMHFYLAAYYVLLSQLTDRTDLAVGVADSNRPDLNDLSTMGLFANILPLRLDYPSNDTFESTLAKTKDRMRAATLHSRPPLHVVLERLGVEQAQDLIQAVFDYKQGQAESGELGGARMAGVLASRYRTPYDVTLEMSDDPTKTPLLTFKLQSSVYEPEDVRKIMSGYLSLVDAFSRVQETPIGEARLNLNVEFVAEN